MINELLTPTNGVAVSAVASPFWLQYIQGISDVAAWCLPIMGVIWLGVQMYSHFKRNK